MGSVYLERNPHNEVDNDLMVYIMNLSVTSQR